MVRDGLARTGYDEVTLTSLSSADFSGIGDVVASDHQRPRVPGQVSVSLPSLRVDAFTVGMAAEIQKVRRTGLTFAPEAGTWRMRQVINKLIREEDLYAAVDAAFSQGWRRVKLYFLTGLPTETDEDTLGIAELAGACVEIGRRYHRSVTVTASVGGFVPKPHTPFQWFGQNTVDELRRKIGLLRDAARGTRGDAALARPRGDARRGDRQPRRPAHRRGHRARVAGRGDLPGVVRALRPRPVDERARRPPGSTSPTVVYRHRDEHEVLPWDHISAGLHHDFLWQDWQEALAEHGLQDCRWTPCYDCGACTGSASSTWWPRRPARGRQPGHRPGPGRGRHGAGAVPGDRRGRLGRRGRSDRPVKVRIRFTKLGKVRWTSHRDVARMWERALRRAGCRWRYTAGFTPRPQVSFGLALPTGLESMAEYLDIVLDEPVDPAELGATSVGPMLPDGVDVVAAVPSSRAPSLQEDVSSCTWEIEVPGVDPRRPRRGDRARCSTPPSLPVGASARGARWSTTCVPRCWRFRVPVADADGAAAPGGARHPAARRPPSELAQALGVELGLPEEHVNGSSATAPAGSPSWRTPRAPPSCGSARREQYEKGSFPCPIRAPGRRRRSPPARRLHPHPQTPGRAVPPKGSTPLSGGSPTASPPGPGTEHRAPTPPLATPQESTRRPVRPGPATLGPATPGPAMQRRDRRRAPVLGGASPPQAARRGPPGPEPRPEPRRGGERGRRVGPDPAPRSQRAKGRPGAMAADRHRRHRGSAIANGASSAPGSATPGRRARRWHRWRPCP